MSRRRAGRISARDAEGSPLQSGDAIRSLDNVEHGVISRITKDPRGLPILIVRGFAYPMVSPHGVLLMESRAQRWRRAMAAGRGIPERGR